MNLAIPPHVLQQPRLDYVMCASPSGTHRMAYWEWGDPYNDKVLLCVHGLTRTGRDFDHLARSLCGDYRVVCPDIVGRGKSDWLVNSSGYVVPQYVADMLMLIARLNPAQLDWVGTSMGGLIGLALAGTLSLSAMARLPRGRTGLSPDQNLSLNKMVLNDIGPRLSLAGLNRIAQYVGEPIQFPSFSEAVQYVRAVSAGFGWHDQSGWEELTQHVFTQDGGRWTKHYDLRIADPFAGQSNESVQASEALLWAAYESISAPMLLMRGELSDLFTAETAQEMLERNKHASLVEIPGVGHAPTLRTSDQIGPIAHFLRS